MAATIGTRAAYSALVCQRSLVPGCFVGVSSTPAKAAKLTTRHLSKSSAPNFCAAAAAAALPEDRLKAARRKARADLGLTDDKNGKISTVAARDVSVSAKAHPEDRLKAARRKMLESMGLTVDNDGKVVESRASAPTSASAGNSNCSDDDESAPLPICAQNNHPDHRLKVARERMLAKVRGDAGVDTGITAATSSGSLKPPRIDLDMSPDRRLRLARTEQAAKPIQTFKPMKRKKRRPKTGALLSRLTCSTEQPPLLRNDGYSSGSVAAMRLREARHGAIERLLVSSSSADASLLPSSSSKEKSDTRR